MLLGEESGCIELSEVNEVVEALDLDTEQVEALFEEIEGRGFELSDDCGRDAPEQVSYTNDELAAVTAKARGRGTVAACRTARDRRPQRVSRLIKRSGSRAPPC